MITMVRDRLSYANVMATIAVFLALAGVAGASGMLKKNSVTSKTIKNGQVKTADLHKGAVTAAAIAPGAVTASAIAPDAVSGTAVKDDSLTGADIDESTLKLNTPSTYGTIPSGSTVTGSWNYYDLAAPSVDVSLVEAFPAPAPAPLTDANVNFEKEQEGGAIYSDPDPACNGTATSPTAPPGKVCIYIDHGQTTIEALAGYALQYTPSDPTSRFGFQIDSAVGANGTAGGTWAYTAP